MTLPCPPITSLQQIADLGFRACKGKKPPTGERELEVLFRCGWVGKYRYRAADLRWSIEQHPFDVVGYR
jgi:hypothetical protein